MRKPPHTPYDCLEGSSVDITGKRVIVACRIMQPELEMLRKPEDDV